MQGPLNRIWLPEIDIMRCLVVIMLVLYHAFAPYAFGWDALPNHDSDNVFYYWIGKVAYSGMLEAFVMIAGYIFAFGLRKKQDHRTIIIKKIKRLYVPAIKWGLVIILIFNYNHGRLCNTIIMLLNGIGHLWFLPMLFWCFVFELYLGQKISNKYLLIFAYLCTLPYPAIPVIKISLYYCFFFHLGVLFFNNRQKVQKWLTANRFILVLMVYAILFVVSTMVIARWLQVDDTTPIVKKTVVIHIRTMLRLCYSILAVIIYYYIGYHLQVKRSACNIIHSIAIYSFGIYIFQEILLRLIYYRSDVLLRFPDYMVPWLGFLLVFVCSYCLSYLLNRCRVTKFLF